MRWPRRTRSLRWLTPHGHPVALPVASLQLVVPAPPEGYYPLPVTTTTTTLLLLLLLRLLLQLLLLLLLPLPLTGASSRRRTHQGPSRHARARCAPVRAFSYPLLATTLYPLLLLTYFLCRCLGTHFDSDSDLGLYSNVDEP